MENQKKQNIQHTYLVYRKLNEDNYLFDKWKGNKDGESLNFLLKDSWGFFQMNMKSFPINNCKHILFVSEFNGYNFVFIREVDEYSADELIIMVNYFPVGIDFTQNENDCLEGFITNDLFKFSIIGSINEFIEKDREEICIEGEYFLIEEESKYLETIKNFRVINTHEAFCNYCDAVHEGRKTLKEGKLMLNDFNKFIKLEPTSTGKYTYIRLDKTLIVTGFIPLKQGYSFV